MTHMHKLAHEHTITHEGNEDFWKNIYLFFQGRVESKP